GAGLFVVDADVALFVERHGGSPFFGLFFRERARGSGHRCRRGTPCQQGTSCGVPIVPPGGPDLLADNTFSPTRRGQKRSSCSAAPKFPGAVEGSSGLRYFAVRSTM